MIGFSTDTVHFKWPFRSFFLPHGGSFVIEIFFCCSDFTENVLKMYQSIEKFYLEKNSGCVCVYMLFESL